MFIWVIIIMSGVLVFHAALTHVISIRRQAVYYSALIMLSFLATARATEPITYSTLAEAAIAGLDAADALAPDAEAAGTIYTCYGRYVIVGLVTDGKKNSVRFEVPTFTSCKLAAIFHTHSPGIRRFSIIDINTTCDYNTIGILRPKGGEATMFDCRTLSYARVNELTQNNSRPVYGTPLGEPQHE